jgi:hypothetical protein
MASASVWFALQWTPSWFAVGLFAATGGVLLYLACRPAIRITDACLKLGDQDIPWTMIRRIEYMGWLTPLIVRLTLADDSQRWIIYPGTPEASQTLLQFLHRFAESAAMGNVRNAGQAKVLPSPKYPLLRPEDEEEVERLYHRLRSVGHIDPRSSDEN